MVRKERLELSRVTPLVPKTSASTNSATFARVDVQGYDPTGASGPAGSAWARYPSGEELHRNHPMMRGIIGTRVCLGHPG